MSRNSKPRSTLQPGRLIQPEFGARHQIRYDDDLDLFFGELQFVLSETIPPKMVTKKVTQAGQVINTLRPKPQFRVYDDPARAGVSVLERRLPRSFANRTRVRWTKNDEGRIKGEIQNEIGRLELGHLPISATFTDVVRLGDADEGTRARKIGLIVDQESDVSELLVSEHELVVRGISSSLKRFNYPYSSFLPHWTVARVHREAGPRAMSEAMTAVGHLLPITVTLEPIRLYSQQNIEVEMQRSRMPDTSSGNRNI